MEIAVSLLGLKVYWYGVMVTLGIGLGWWLARRRAKLYGLKKETVDSAWLWMFGPAVVGSRLYHVISEGKFYWLNPGEIVKIGNGGLGIIGAIVGGILGLGIFARVKGVKFLRLTDLLAPSLALAQVVGRWGNWFNQEAYGWPTNLPWGMFVSLENRLPGFEGFSHFHPWMVYESMLDLVNLGVLLWVSSVILRRNKVTTKNPLQDKDKVWTKICVELKNFFAEPFDKLRVETRTKKSRTSTKSMLSLSKHSVKNSFKNTEGLITALYLINYGMIRFFLEFLRLDTPVGFLGLKAAQWWGVGMVGGGILLMKKKISSG